MFRRPVVTAGFGRVTVTGAPGGSADQAVNRSPQLPAGFTNNARLLGISLFPRNLYQSNPSPLDRSSIVRIKSVQGEMQIVLFRTRGSNNTRKQQYKHNNRQNEFIHGNRNG